MVDAAVVHQGRGRLPEAGDLPEPRVLLRLGRIHELGFKLLVGVGPGLKRHKFARLAQLLFAAQVVELQNKFGIVVRSVRHGTSSEIGNDRW